MRIFPIGAVTAIAALLLSGCVVAAPPVGAISTAKACSDWQAEFKATSELLSKDPKYSGTSVDYQLDLISRLGPYTIGVSPALRANGSDKAIELAEVFENFGANAKKAVEMLRDVQGKDGNNGPIEPTDEQSKINDEFTAAFNKLLTKCDISSSNE